MSNGVIQVTKPQDPQVGDVWFNTDKNELTVIGEPGQVLTVFENGDAPTWKNNPLMISVDKKDEQLYSVIGERLLEIKQYLKDKYPEDFI